MNQALKESWNDFKKDITWNNFKILVSGLIPMIFYMYLWTYWFQYLIELLTHKYDKPKTIEEAIITLCILCGMLAPIFFAIWFAQLGFWIGKVTKFFRDDKNRSIWWDDVTYFVRDMPQDQRDKIKEILSPYKSKLQLKKEKLANKSWLRRNFS